MDFTLKTYENLLTALQDKGFIFQPFHDFLERPEEKTAVLRHDVDKLPGNALQMAQVEHRLGIRGSYYFRVVKESWDEDIIRQIAGMGHEVGYHYEDLSLCRGNHGEAIRHFEEQLKRFREMVDVKTICMHGSPLSKRDNRDLWKHYNYRDYGIIGEPYFDVDFSNVFYLTDTGRRWDGENVSIRDKIFTNNPPVQTHDHPSLETHGRASLPRDNHHASISHHGHTYKSTNDIINAIKNNTLPHPLMITIHPQRWTDSFGPWLWELVWQNVKNVVKKVMVINDGRRRKKYRKYRDAG